MNDFPSVLPPAVQQLTEATSIALAQQIQQTPIQTSLQEDAIATTYVKAGSGEPILFLHGFDSSVFEFRRLIPKLSVQYETWAVDLLGFGFTERPLNVAISPETITAHLYAFWKGQIDRPVTLVGASMGGAAALDFALAYPDAVRSLVLLDSAGFTAGPAMGKYLIEPLGFLATEFLRNASVRQSISRNAYHDPTFASPDALCCAALHLTQPNWRRSLISFTRSGGYRSYQARLSQIQQPTLILWGRSDRILGIAPATQFQQAIAHSELVWVEDCGHVPHLEQPEITANAIAAFLQHQTFPAGASTSSTAE